MKFSDRVNYHTILRQMYGALYRSNVGLDFVFPESTNLSDYKVILVPPLYIASDAVLRKLADYVKGGGNILVSFKSGFCNEYSTVRWEMAPGPLREAAGLHYQEFSSLVRPLALKDDPFQAGTDNKVSEWAEMLLPDTAKALASYDHPFFGKYPAITRNSFGKGTLTYAGTVLSDKLLESVILDVLKEAGLTSSDRDLPAPVRVKHASNRSGKTLHCYFNYSSDPQSFSYAYGSGMDLLAQAAVDRGQKLTLKPWDAAIVEEK
jgi:beta-galactosidase